MSFVVVIFFVPELPPQAISLFFRRLGWLVLLGAFAPLVVVGVDLYWMYFYCHSYLYPELGLTGLQEGVVCFEKCRSQLSYLYSRPDLYDSGRVDHLVNFFDELSTRYLRLLNRVEKVTPPGKPVIP